MFAQHWMQPAPESLLDRWLRHDRAPLPPGSFQCGLRTPATVSGLSDEWRYWISTIAAGTLLVATPHRRRAPSSYRLYLPDATPIDPEREPKAGFLVWRAELRDTAAVIEIAVSDRDAYKILDSALRQR